MSSDLDRARARRSSRIAAGVVFGLALLIAGLIISGQGGSHDMSTMSGADGSTPATMASDAGSTGPASCVETYDLQSLTGRDLAFDGSVQTTVGDEVTFVVNRWYWGGNMPSITLNGASTLTAVTSGGAPLRVEPGERLLVAGDDGFAWSCGFTQPFQPSLARSWAAAAAER